MFDKNISIIENDKNNSIYLNMVSNLEKKYSFKSSAKSNDITNQEDFVELYGLTKEFYEATFSEIFKEYVPVYKSLWKQRLKDLKKIDNIHQDGGVHYFSKNGYQSRMVTIWTNIYKDNIEGLSKSDMGIFVIENDEISNLKLYDLMEKEDTHFISKEGKELVDNMYVAGSRIEYNTDTLKRKYFNFEEGTSILFNSHLLHGSKSYDHDLSNYTDENINKFRVSLTSVWIHREDLDVSVVNLSEDKHENLYLSKQPKEMWNDIKDFFGDACQDENNSLNNIKKLIKVHG